MLSPYLLALLLGVTHLELTYTIKLVVLLIAELFLALTAFICTKISGLMTIAVVYSAVVRVSNNMYTCI